MQILFKICTIIKICQYYLKFKLCNKTFHKNTKLGLFKHTVYDTTPWVADLCKYSHKSDSLNGQRATLGICIKNTYTSVSPE